MPIVNRGKMATTSPESTHKQYVDDGSTMVRGATMEQLAINIKEDFKGIQHYLQRHQMIINPGKTQLMQIKPLQKETLKVELEGTVITSQEAIKILGLTINNELKYDEYLWKDNNSLVRRIQTRTSKVAALKSFLPPKTLNQIGNSLINSTIQYGAALWGATSDKNIKIIQAAQIRSARILTKNWNRKGDGIHRQHILDQVQWPNVNQLIASATLNLTKNAISGKSSTGMNSLFKVTRPPEANRNQCLRIDHKGKATRTTLSFSANATQMFNQLPAQLRASTLTTKKFKTQVKEHISNNFKLPQH